MKISKRESSEMSEYILPLYKLNLTAFLWHSHIVSYIYRCWLPSEKGVIFAFIGPMVAIIVVSIILAT